MQPSNDKAGRALRGGDKREPSRPHRRTELLAELNREFPRFQRASETVDAAASAVLALKESDLWCIDVLRQGPLPEVALAEALGLSARQTSTIVARLESAGYVRPIARAAPSAERQRELTDHALEWIESLWGPIRDEGFELMQSFSTRELAAFTRFLREGTALQNRHAARIRALAELPASGRPRGTRAHGGLSPAALRRVQLFALANLGRRVRLEDLAARAGVSLFHFARAFRTSTGETPYAFVQRLRVEKAQQLLGETDLPLGRIALECGYSSQSKLTHAVRRATGLTPGRLREAGR